MSVSLIIFRRSFFALAGSKSDRGGFCTCAAIVHKVLESETPIYLRELLCSNSSMHSVYAPSTRRGADLSVPAHRTVKFTASFSYLSSLYYNSLPLDIRSLTSMPAFKCARSIILVHYP